MRQQPQDAEQSAWECAHVAEAGAWESASEAVEASYAAATERASGAAETIASDEE